MCPHIVDVFFLEVFIDDDDVDDVVFDVLQLGGCFTL